MEPRQVKFEESRFVENTTDPVIKPLLALAGFQGPLVGEFVDGDRFFKLSSPLIYQSNKGWPHRDGQGATQVFVVEAGFVCDLESIPRWAMPFTASAKCGVLHDMLYDKGLLSRADADAVYFEALNYQLVAEWRCWARWTGVRLGGWWPWRRYRLDQDMSAGGACM